MQYCWRKYEKKFKSFSIKFTEFLKKLSYIFLNLTDGILYRIILQQLKYRIKREPRRRRNFFQNLTWNYVLCNRFFENFAKIFLNGAFGAEFWALRAQNLAPQSPKYWGDRFSTVGPILGAPPMPPLNSPLGWCLKILA